MCVQALRDEDFQASYLKIGGDGPSSPLLFLVPGNPGLCEYYEPFLLELKQNLPRFELVAVSSLGFDVNSEPVQLSTMTEHRTLNEQIQHKREFLQKYVTSRRDVYLLGHSVGAWMVQRLVVDLAKDPLINIRFVGLLMPTIKDIALSQRGRTLTFFISWGLTGNIAARALDALIAVVPHSWIEWFLKHKFSEPHVRAAAIVTKNMVSRPSIVKQIVDMGAEEMGRIGAEIEPCDIKGFWSARSYHIWGLFAQHDHWIPEITRRSLLAESENRPNVTLEICADATIPHGFCVGANADVAKLTAEAIEKYAPPKST